MRILLLVSQILSTHFVRISIKLWCAKCFNDCIALCFFQITWTDGTGMPLMDGVRTYISTMAVDNRRFSTRSVLKLTPKKEYHNTSVWCQAQSKASGDNKLRTKIHVHVRYAPKVSNKSTVLLVIAKPPRVVLVRWRSEKREKEEKNAYKKLCLCVCVCV